MNEVPRVAVRGVAGGLLLMAFFTALWTAWVLPAGSPAITTAIAVPFFALAVLFLAQGIRLFVLSGRFPVVATTDRGQPSKPIGPRFGIIFAIEGALIGATSGILFATGLGDYLAPAIALIVGLHFIPLARVFDRTIDYWVAAWVILVAITGILLIAFSPLDPVLVSGLVGIGTAIGTSVYGIYMLTVERSLLARAA